MNLFVSIFGGILLTAIIFGVVRSFKQSNFWAAVAAASLPSFAYMAYSASNWPGLDVLTIHVVAFPTVALLLFQIGGAKDAPYRPIHWAPKLLIGFFVIITVILGGFVYIAGNGVSPAIARWLLPNVQGKTLHTGFAGVVPHGEDASKSIAYYRNMDKKLQNLGWHVEVFGLDLLSTGYPGEVRVQINVQANDGQTHPVEGVTVNLGMARPGQKVEQSVNLQQANDGSYRGQVTLTASGEWLAVFTLEHAGERIVFERTLASK